MSQPMSFDEATVQSVRHYLDQTIAIIERLARENNADTLLATRLAPDMFDTGFNFAIAIQFAARSLCPPAGIAVPEVPETYTVESLGAYADTVSRLIEPITANQMVHRVQHIAGDAELSQDPAEYVCGFALPNMIFHLSIAYAGLRHSGMQIGKADFDGYHIY